LLDESSAYLLQVLGRVNEVCGSVKQASDVRTGRTSITWLELLGVTIAASLLVALIWIDAHLRGAVGIPRDDDWSYLRTIFAFAETGTFALNGWVHMMFVGQAVPGAVLVNLVGPSITALQAANAVAAVAALLLLYAVSRQLLSVAPALFLTVILGVNPVFAHLVVTAMTDLPVLGLQAGCLLCGLLALRRESPSWPLTVGAVACGMAAFTIREYGAVVLLAVIAVLLIRYGRHYRDRNFRNYLVGLILLLSTCALVAAGLWTWRRGLPYDIVNVPIPLDQALLLLIRAAAVLALMVAPMWFAVSWSGLRRGFASVPVAVPLLGALIGSGVVLMIVTTGNQVLGNIIHPFGSTWTSVGDGIRAVPLVMFRGLQVLSYISLILLCAVAAAAIVLGISSLRQRAGTRSVQARQWQIILLVTVTLALLGSYVVATAILGAPLIDRYFLIVAPVMGVVMVAGIGSWQQSTQRRLQSVAVGAAIVGAVIVGAAFVDASAQVDGARWRVAQNLVEQGVDPEVIDAGDPWFRYHQQGPGRTTADATTRPWWVAFFPDARACWTVVLTRQQEPGAWGDERSSTSIRTLLGEEGRLIVVRGPDACAR